MDKTTKYMASSIIGAAFTFIIALLIKHSFIVIPNAEAETILLPTASSIWESLKLIFWPSLLFFMLQFILFGHKDSDHLPMAAASLAFGVIAAATAYYFLLGATGTDSIDIALIFGMLTTYVSSYLLMRDGALGSNGAIITGGVLYADLIAMFVYFSFRAPEIPIFIG